jgi:hypothetical protein
MNSSATRARRKWASRLKLCGQRTLWAGAVLLLIFWAAATEGWSAVPLPRPRPADAPRVQQSTPGGPEADQPTTDDGKAGEIPPAADNAAAAKPAAVSPCRAALTDAIAVAPSIAPIRGPGACGGEDLVRLEAVVLPTGQRVAVKPAAILRCTMASAIADWVRTDMATLAQGLGSALSEVDNFDSFECRGRNRVVGAKLSEHGRANALDVRGLKLSSGQFISLTDRAEPRAVREHVLQSVCARFSTVLGPGSDWYHEDHIHLDLAERRGGYRICQWNVYDPLPTVAPLLPTVRPDEAPPREEVAGGEKTETASPPQAAHQAAPQVAEPEAADAKTDEPEAAEPKPTPAPVKPPAKKRKPRHAAQSPLEKLFQLR